MWLLGNKQLPNEDNLLNIKGMGEIKKNLTIKEVLRKFKTDIIMLQETKDKWLIQNASTFCGEVGIKIGFLTRLKGRLEE